MVGVTSSVEMFVRDPVLSIPVGVRVAVPEPVPD